MARTLLLTLGAEKLGPGATTQTGGAALLAVLKSQGVDTGGWVIDNGAGLSRTGRLTAQGLAGMLDAAWRSPLMPEFIRSEEHTSELQSLMRISYAVFCLKKKKQ